ncbi:hypothetical protein E4U41_002565 [Claviceps citrina]|nr:hypothetical protein E4U41_002565 [Claviceps citrina]
MLMVFESPDLRTDLLQHTAISSKSPAAKCQTKTRRQRSGAKVGGEMEPTRWCYSLLLQMSGGRVSFNVGKSVGELRAAQRRKFRITR